MCGRITQDLNLKMLFDRYRLSQATPALNLKARYNGCPIVSFSRPRETSSSINDDGHPLARFRSRMTRSGSRQRSIPRYCQRTLVATQKESGPKDQRDRTRISECALIRKTGLIRGSTVSSAEPESCPSRLLPCISNT